MSETTNPFKLWGSYIGALIILFIPLPLGLATVPPYTLIPFIFESAYGVLSLFILIPMVIGFLIGYGIHLLIRKLRNEGQAK